MQINGSLYLASAPANGNIRIKAFEVTTPGTPVATKDFANPSFPFNFSLTVPNDVVHNVQVYDSDLTTDGTLLASFVYDPKFSSVDIKGDRIMVVGNTGDPVAGTTEFDDASLDGFTYSIERRGIGTIIPDDEWEYVTGGGFKLITTGDVFNPGETFILHFYPKITTVTPSAGGSTKFISGIAAAITADTTLDDTYYNQLIPLNSATNKLAIILTKIADTPANTLFVFDTSMGGQNNSVISASGTDSILWNGTDRSAMYMGKNEQLWLMKGADGWHVLESKGGFSEVGRQFFAHMVLPNTIELNGSLLNRADYPRLFNDYVNKLPLAMIVSEANWVTNKGKFTLGDGSTTFRICDSRGLFTRNADSGAGIDIGRTVGSYQADGIKSWSIDVTIPPSNTSKSDAGVGRFTTGSDGNEPSGLSLTVAYVGETETRPKNEAKIALIAI